MYFLVKIKCLVCLFQINMICALCVFLLFFFFQIPCLRYCRQPSRKYYTIFPYGELFDLLTGFHIAEDYNQRFQQRNVHILI